MRETPSDHHEVAVGSRTPPGPLEWPLVGIAFKFARSPLEFMMEMSARYGPIARYRYLFRRAYQVNDIDLVHEVLVERGDAFTKDKYAFSLLRPLLGNGLLTSDGSYWKQQRKRLAPAFGPEQLGRFVPVVVDEARRTLHTLQSQLRPGSTVDFAPMLSDFALCVIGKTVLDVDMEREASDFRAALDAVNQHFCNVTFNPIKAAFMHLSILRNRRLANAIALLDAAIHRLIARDETVTLASRTPFLQQLLTERPSRLTDMQLRDELLTILIAGHETAANALKWIFWLTSQYPAVLDAVYEEALTKASDGLTASDVDQLRYTRAVVLESLRLFPPVWAINRWVPEATTLGGFRLEGNSYVIISPYVIHRSVTYWHAPNEFQPERFLNPTDKMPATYLPFGAGSRVCAGSRFALAEAVIFLSMLALNFRWHVPPGHELSPETVVTLRPRNGLPLIFLPRGDQDIK